MQDSISRRLSLGAPLILVLATFGIVPTAEAAPEATYAVAVASGTWYTCVLQVGGTVHCFGNGEYGSSEDYDGGSVVGLAAGADHTCVLRTPGNVLCYGGGSLGQSAPYNGGDARAVSAGTWHTCVLKSNRNVDCWGHNGDGQAEDYFGQNALAVSAGGFHTCVLTMAHNVDCWGRNYVNPCAPDCSVQTGQASDYFGGDAVAVSAGRFNTCILKVNGNVDCYGDNSDGQSNDYFGGDAVAVSSNSGYWTDYHTCVVRSSGNVLCWGDNTRGQSASYWGGDAVAVTTGGAHTCVLQESGAVSCYGYNQAGQTEGYQPAANNPCPGGRSPCPPPLSTPVDTGGGTCAGHAHGYFKAGEHCEMLCAESGSATVAGVVPTPDTFLAVTLTCDDWVVAICDGYWVCYGPWSYTGHGGPGVCAGAAAGIAIFIDVAFWCSAPGGGIGTASASMPSLPALPALDLAEPESMSAPIDVGQTLCLDGQCRVLEPNSAVMFGKGGVMRGVICGPDGGCADVLPDCDVGTDTIACTVR